MPLLELSSCNAWLILRKHLLVKEEIYLRLDVVIFDWSDCLERFARLGHVIRSVIIRSCRKRHVHLLIHMIGLGFSFVEFVEIRVLWVVCNHFCWANDLIKLSDILSLSL